MADDRFKDSKKSPAQPSFLVKNAGAFLVAAGVCMVASMMAYGSTLKANGPFVIGFVCLGMACLVAWFIGRSGQAAAPRDEWAKQRSLGGINSLISTLLFLVVLFGVNYIAARRHKTFDLTSNKINVLAEQSEKALQKLSGPVAMTYVYAPTIMQRGISPADVALLDKYKNASDRIRVAYVNAAEEPGKLDALKLTGFNPARPVVLVQGEDAKSGARQQIDTIDEQNLTSALMKLGEQKTRVFYHLVGHGEASLDAGSNVSFSRAKEKLTSQGYTFKPLNLATTPSGVPGDASIVAALGPTSDLSAGEAKLLKSYLGGKGRLLVQIAPAAKPLPQWRALAQSLGVNVLDGYVLDPQQSVVGVPYWPYVTVMDVTKHAVLGGVGQNNAVVFPVTSPLKVASPTPQGLTVTSVFESSPSSKAVPFNRGGAMFDGPFTLLATSERAAAAPGAPSANDMRAVFVGSGALGADTNFDKNANGDMFLSAVNWVAGNELLVSIPPKEPVRNTLDMPPSVQRFSIIFSLFALPLAVLLMGGIVWWKRR